MKSLFDDLETKRGVIDLLGRAERAEGVRIFIGSENKLFSLSGSSTIIAPYSDAAGRIGPLDTVFYDTLIDENAASHIAIGAAYEFTAGEDDRERINRSQIHIDFMIGSPEVDVTGVTSGGERVAVLRAGVWQI